MEYIIEIGRILAIPSLVCILLIIIGRIIRSRISEGYSSKVLLNTPVAVLIDLVCITTFYSVLTKQIISYGTEAAQYATLLWYVLLIPISIISSYIGTFKGKTMAVVSILNTVGIQLLYWILLGLA